LNNNKNKDDKNNFSIHLNSNKINFLLNKCKLKEKQSLYMKEQKIKGLKMLEKGLTNTIN